VKPEAKWWQMLIAVLFAPFGAFIMGMDVVLACFECDSVIGKLRDEYLEERRRACETKEGKS
jgi:hypothetical protein